MLNTRLGAVFLLLLLRVKLGHAKYFWPEARGRPDSYGVSAFSAPRKLTKRALAWTWSIGGPWEKYSQEPLSAVLIDDKEDLYLSSYGGIYKLSSEGELLWSVPMATWRVPTILDGRLYITDNGGMAYAISMETGKQLWAARFTDVLGTDLSGLTIIDGVLIGEARAMPGGGGFAISGLNVTDGSLLWEFKVDCRLWNSMPMDSGDGTFIFQDQIGGVYRVRTRDGQQLWRSGYTGSWKDDFTDGMAMVKDGTVYAVHSDGQCCPANGGSTLRAYDLASGADVWSQRFGHPLNSQPVVGYLGEGSGLSRRLSVVVAVGAQPNGVLDNYGSLIGAFDAKTGERIWEWAPPEYLGTHVAGDVTRILHGTLCLPNPYGSPSIDARGTVYVGHFNGMIYAIRDDNGDGMIQDSEVSQYNTGAGFSHGGAALGPGMLAIPSCDTLYVFKE